MLCKAQQRSEELRAKFLIDVSVFEPEMLIFVNETGSDKRAALLNPFTDELFFCGGHFSLYMN